MSFVLHEYIQSMSLLTAVFLAPPSGGKDHYTEMMLACAAVSENINFQEEINLICCKFHYEINVNEMAWNYKGIY